MTIRLRKTSQNLLRTGLVMLTAGALLFSANVAPAFAAEGPTDTAAPISVTAPSHPADATNVVITVQGQNVTVVWQRPVAHTYQYKVALKQGRRIIAVRNGDAPLAEFGPDLVKAGESYHITIQPLDRWAIDPLPGSGVESDQFTIAAAPPAEEVPAPPSGSETNPPSGGETVQPPAPPVAPGVANSLSLRLALKDSTAVEAFWFEPSGDTAVTGYEVQLTGSDNSTKLAQADMEADLPEYAKFSDLTPGVSYQVKVRAQNAGAWGEWTAQSNTVVVPANQRQFKMQVDGTGFGVTVTPNRDTASVSWSQTGYEPETAVFSIRIKCSSACAHGFKNRVEQFSARSTQTAWRIEDLPAGNYVAELTLQNFVTPDNVPDYSKRLTSNVFTIGVPVEVANPQLTVTPSTTVDPAQATTLSVAGTGYVGNGAIQGTYLVVADLETWTPGQHPNLQKIADFVAQKYIKPFEIRNGAFSAEITIPAGALKAGKQYFVGTMAAHALSIVDRSLDQRVDLTLKAASPEQPQSTPDKAQSEPDKAQSEPDKAQSEPDKAQSEPDKAQSEPDKAQSEPDKAQSTPDKPQSEPKAVSVTPVAKGGKPAQTSFVQGQAVILEFSFENAPEGSVWDVVLHSDPVSLGQVVVKNGRAVLKFSAETAAKFVAGAHTLKFTQAGVADPQVINIPWTVIKAEKVTPAAPTLDPQHLPKVDTSDQGKAATDTGKSPSQSAKQGSSASPAKSSSNSGKLASTGADAGAVALLSIAMLAAGVIAHRTRRLNG